MARSPATRWGGSSTSCLCSRCYSRCSAAGIDTTRRDPRLDFRELHSVSIPSPKEDVMRRLSVIGLAATLSLLGIAVGTRAASALDYSGAGLRMGFTVPEDVDGTALLGAQAEFTQPGTDVHFIPGFQYWRSNGLSDLNVNADLDY